MTICFLADLERVALLVSDGAVRRRLSKLQ
jgi:hypothetical protein